MPFAFTCPECQTKLKTAAPVPTGRPVQCPKCAGTFTLQPGDVVEVGAAAPPSPPPAPTARSSPPPRSRDDDAPRSRRRDEDDEPQSRRRDDDDEPRSRRRGEDEPTRRRTYDDEPRSRRRNDDDDSRSRRDDDDAPRRRTYDDDAPVRRRTHDDDYDRPVRRKSGNKGVMIGLVILGLLVLGGVAFLIYWLLNRSDNYDKEMLAYLPSDTTIVVALDVDAAMKTENTKEALQQEEVKALTKEFTEKTGLKWEDFQRAVVGVSDPFKGGEPEVVAVVRFKRSIDVDKVMKNIPNSKKTKDGKTYYELTRGDGVMYFPSEAMGIFASSEKVLTSQVFSSTDTIRYSSELQELSKSVSKHQVWGAMTVSGNLRQKMQLQPDQLQMAQAFLPKLGPILSELPNAKGFVLYANDDGKNLTYGVGMKVGSRDAAKKVAESAKGLISEGTSQALALAEAGKKGGIPDDIKSFVKKVSESVESDTDGEIALVSVSFNFKELTNLTKKYGAGGFGPGGGGFGPGGGGFNPGGGRIDPPPFPKNPGGFPFEKGAFPIEKAAPPFGFEKGVSPQFK